MIVSLIAAMGENRVIGKNNQMMWHLPLEYKYFKDTTMDHCIVMGRKNYEAIGRPLPGRTNIIITRQKDYQASGCVVVNSLDEALEHATSLGEREVFITGGGEIYQLALPLADKIYLTEVDYHQPGDVYFPEFDETPYHKQLVQQMDVEEKNSLAWQAFVYTKKV